MNSPSSPRKASEPGIVWFVIPAMWVAAAMAGLVILTYWPTLLADPLPPQGNPGSSSVEAAPQVSRDPSLPAASTVFKGRPHEVSEHVDQF
jgi:hypothetical protein